MSTLIHVLVNLKRVYQLRTSGRRTVFHSSSKRLAGIETVRYRELQASILMSRLTTPPSPASPLFKFEGKFRYLIGTTLLNF